MKSFDFNQLQAETLSLSHADRTTLAQELIASLDAQQPDTIESDYQQRMRNYIDRAWLLAANTLTSYSKSGHRMESSR